MVFGSAATPTIKSYRRTCRPALWRSERSGRAKATEQATNVNRAGFSGSSGGPGYGNGTGRDKARAAYLRARRDFGNGKRQFRTAAAIRICLDQRIC